MKVKYIILLFIFGVLISVIGALFKLMHWPGASKTLLIGTLIRVFSGIIFIIKLITNNKFKGFLNW